MTYPARPAWDAETIISVREWAAAGVSQREIGRRLGLAQFSVAIRMADAGIETKVRKPRSGEMERAAVVLVEHFASHPDLNDLLRLYRQARGSDRPTLKGMRTHARHLRLFRPDDSVLTGAKRGAATVRAIHAAAADELAPRLQESLSVTCSVPLSAAALGISCKRARRLVRMGMVTLPPKPKVAKVAKAPKPKEPPAARRPNKLPASWVRAEPPPPKLKPTFQSVEAWLAAGNRITQCPAAAAYVTTATLGEDRELIRQHAEVMAADDGNWITRAKRKMGRFHFGVGK